ncbi:MAG: TetR/AcrR family transcriptional regulator [Rhodospirillales bacterium]|nr:TetR/AcrR family transcriptional regulator [Rhodospirillales bacterium]MDE2198136.1 TetR/AcrR family transcriptional regulator [Rhodospirillales bacterium]MDE2575341.1 TetR/AcrR family transcriptional regulator [Rhodospirillales bacterium]
MTMGGAAESSPRRQRMLEAGAGLFMAHGYAAVSMDAVARAADVSKATLYAHFASKDALFATIVADACQRNSADDAAFPTDTADIGAALREIGGRGLRFLLQPRTLAIYRVAVAEAARCPELGEAFLRAGPLAFRDRLAAWMAQQSAAGRLATPDPAVAAEHFMALIRAGLFLRASLAIAPAPAEAEIDATVAAAVQTFLRAFAA